MPASPPVEDVEDWVPGAPPENHLGFAVFTTLCCFLPFGIVAIVFAAQVNAKWAGGDHAGAVQASTWAQRFSLAALVVGFLTLIGYVVLGFSPISATLQTSSIQG